MQYILAEEIAFYNTLKLSVSIDSLLDPTVLLLSKNKMLWEPNDENAFTLNISDEILTSTCEPSQIVTWKGLKFRRGT